MKAGEFILARQKGNKGFYARVLLQAEPSPDQVGVRVDFDTSVDEEWRIPAIFGIIYAWEQSARRFPERGLSVQVLEVRWQPVDTSSLCVSFAASFALWSALEHTPRDVPTLDEESGTFCFPKWSS